MRFAKSDGTLIDVYQAATQMTDESGQTYPFTINTLLDNAIGSEGYYGAFTANMHSDNASSSGSDAIIASALARGIPVISARQMLEWLDGRNSSTFSGITWNGTTLTFHYLPLDRSERHHGHGTHPFRPDSEQHYPERNPGLSFTFNTNDKRYPVRHLLRRHWFIPGNVLVPHTMLQARMTRPRIYLKRVSS